MVVSCTMSYNPIVDTDCGCYEAVSMSACCKTISIGQLVTDSEYQVIIQDKFGNQYVVVQAAVDSAVKLAVFQYPDDLLNEYTGDFSLQVFLLSDTSTPIQFTFYGKQYECIEISFRHIEPNIDDETVR